MFRQHKFQNPFSNKKVKMSSKSIFFDKKISSYTKSSYRKSV